jgi:5-methylcytosine-specific restriction protein B
VPIHPQIAKELITLRDTHIAAGEWLSAARLTECYATFRRHFGPEVLASLDGEALLDRMHLHGSKESLVYWLEFKNDEEMPGVFGSIGGGSALKFGIYYNKDSERWTGGSPQHQVELTLDEAIERARKHRDEFIAGARVLEGFSPDNTDEAYGRLQQDLSRAAPTVSDLAWGHKYFSLLYPDKLDAFHAPNYQRYHLVRLLQVPPHAEGRYVCAGRFVSLAHELDMATNHLMRSLVRRNGAPRAYWRIGTRPGDSNIPHEYWPDMIQGSWVGLGWYELKDLTDLANGPHTQATKDELRGRITRAAEGQGKIESVLSNFTNQVFNFHPSRGRRHRSRQRGLDCSGHWQYRRRVLLR